jgi:ferrous iron transport protein B
MSRPDLPLARHAWDVPAAIAPPYPSSQASLVANDGKRRSSRAPRRLLLLTDQDSVRVRAPRRSASAHRRRFCAWQGRWEGGGDGLGRHARQLALRGHRPARTEVVERRPASAPTASDRIDAVVTHPSGAGWSSAGDDAALRQHLHAGPYPMDWIGRHTAALAGLGEGRACPPGDLRDLLTDGVIGGVGGVVVTFLPQILILFFFIGLLESTGYMARAAFIMDR